MILYLSNSVDVLTKHNTEFNDREKLIKIRLFDIIKFNYFYNLFIFNFIILDFIDLDYGNGTGKFNYIFKIQIIIVYNCIKGYHRPR